MRIGKSESTPDASSRALRRLTCQSCRRPSSNLLSITRRPRRSASTVCSPERPHIMQISSSVWPNSAIRKAATLHSIISRPRMSKATIETIASSRGTTSTCFLAVGNEPALRAALSAAQDRPIAFLAVDFDPLARGYVTNLSRPGGNVTGIFVRQVELAAKRVEIAREAFPSAAVVGIAFDGTSREQGEAASEGARKLGLEPRLIEVKGEQGYASAFAAMDDARAQPIISPAGPIFLRDRAAIAQALLERRIPSVAAFRENMEAGALISYGFEMGLFYDIASYVHRIAGGAKPSDMPIEQSPRFYMAVNLKTAASLGVSLSDAFIARANEVRE